MQPRLAILLRSWMRGPALQPALFRHRGGSNSVAAIGGPIIKNKLFFFGDFQGTRQAADHNQHNGPDRDSVEAAIRATNICDLSTSGFCRSGKYIRKPFNYI